MNVETRYCKRCESQTVGERGRCYECGSTSWREGRLVRYRMRGRGVRPTAQLAGQVDMLSLLGEGGELT